MKHCLIFYVFLAKISFHSNVDGTFIASFQPSGDWSSDEYLDYTGGLPALEEFSSCHWQRTASFSEETGTIWAYCQHFTANDWVLRCIEFSLKYPNFDGKVHLYLYYNGWINDTTFFEIMHAPSDYHHQRWNHFCIIYSSKRGASWLYHNGKLISNLSFNDNTIDGTKLLPVIPESNKAYDFSLIVGQEPDSMKGNFSKTQAFKGDISELNVWDGILSTGVIEAMSSCLQWPKGNIVEWQTWKWVKNKVQITENVDVSKFCETETTYFLFPEQLTFAHAIKKCKVHGGKISAPKTKEENNKIKTIFQKIENIFAKEIKTIEHARAWLGLENQDGIWYEMQMLGNSHTPIDYDNWREFYSTSRHRDNKLCPYIHDDGTWAYERDKVCEYLKNTVVCSFTQIPTFILKGKIEKLTKVERLYFMSLDDSNQVIGFSGLSGRNSISYDNRKMWSFQTNENGLAKLFLDQLFWPVGRNSWFYFGDNDQGSEILSLSFCKLEEEFTCDSGQCIPMIKRCDRSFDCEDTSDELSCHKIEIPLSYSRNNAPSVFDGKMRVTKLPTQCVVEKVDFIDTINTKIGLTLTLKMYWNDSRLIFKNLHRRDKSTLRKAMYKKLWLPLDNSVHVYAILGKILPDGNQQVEIHGKYRLPIDLRKSREDYYYSGSNNTLSIAQRFQVEYDCHFDMQNYPFDKQTCRFGLDIKGKDDERFLLIHNVSESISYIGSKHVGDFEIIEITDNATICKRGLGEADIKSSTPEFLLCIMMKRSHADQIVSIYIPSILFWLLAYFTLFLDIRDVANRSRTSVTLLLVYIALLQTVKKDFPKTTYYKYIDMWFLWYIFNNFLISLYHIILPRILKIGVGRDILSMKGKGNTRKSAWSKETEVNDVELMVAKMDLVLVYFLPLVMIVFNVIYFTFTR